MRAARSVFDVAPADDAGGVVGADRCQFCGRHPDLLHRVPGERWAICDDCLDEAGRTVRLRGARFAADVELSG